MAKPSVTSPASGLPSRSFTLKSSICLASGVFAAIFFACLSLHPTPMVRAAVPASVELGTKLFQEKGCQHCHGADGRGGDLGPDLSTVGKRLKNPQIEAQIRNGGGGMPAFADALQPDEISALVEFLHTKRKSSRQKKGTSN